MKRLLCVMIFAGLLSACHPWVGRPVTQLEKKMGRPLSIRSEGENKVYVYRDTLAGYGQMTFTVDSHGIIRDWDATNNLQASSVVMFSALATRVVFFRVILN